MDAVPVYSQDDDFNGFPIDVVLVCLGSLVPHGRLLRRIDGPLPTRAKVA